MQQPDYDPSRTTSPRLLRKECMSGIQFAKTFEVCTPEERQRSLAYWRRLLRYANAVEEIKWARLMVRPNPHMAHI